MLRIAATNLLVKARPVQLRHEQVADHEVERGQRSAGSSACRPLAASSTMWPSAARISRQHVADVLLVVDDQHAT